MTETVRILLVDDQRLMRDGLRTLFELEARMDVVGEAQNGQQALDIYNELQPDLVLMDVRMPVMDGVEATRTLLKIDPQARVIILTTFDDDEYVLEGLRAGALGYLLKDVSIQELTDAIHTVMSGGILIEPSVARKVVAELSRLGTTSPRSSSPMVEPLSDREQEILEFLARGFTNREIAQKVHLAEGTVKNYVTNILGKIGARDRTHAAIRARDLGLL
ncbi:MAG: response regulator transcription factor [Chloroflexota bacterium]|nr:response regulator transcription factor [Chloroflexota bacterium]